MRTKLSRSVGGGGFFSLVGLRAGQEFRLFRRDIALLQQKYSISGMFIRPGRHRHARFIPVPLPPQALQRRIDRWHTMTFYGAISFIVADRHGHAAVSAVLGAERSPDEAQRNPGSYCRLSPAWRFAYAGYAASCGATPHDSPPKPRARIAASAAACSQRLTARAAPRSPAIRIIPQISAGFARRAPRSARRSASRAGCCTR